MPSGLPEILDFATLLYELILCIVGWHVTRKNRLFLDSFLNLKPWNDLLLPYLCWTHLWFLSHPIKTILPLGEDWLFGLCRIMSSSKPAVMGKEGLSMQAKYTFPVSFSKMCCLLNFSFKGPLGILTRSHYFVAKWWKHSVPAFVGVYF